MKKKKLDKAVLAEGEATGHAHRIADDSVEVYELRNGLREFKTEHETEIVHEEHKPILLPPGEWVSGRVEEFDHFDDKKRQVID